MGRVVFCLSLRRDGAGDGHGPGDAGTNTDTDTDTDRLDMCIYLPTLPTRSDISPMTQS